MHDRIGRNDDRAAPTVTPKSTAICGSSESAERTIAWLANPATASSTMARVCDGTGMAGEGASTLVDRVRGGFSATIPKMPCRIVLRLPTTTYAMAAYGQA